MVRDVGKEGTGLCYSVVGESADPNQTLGQVADIGSEIFEVSQRSFLVEEPDAGSDGWPIW